MKTAFVLIGAPGYNRGSEILLTGILELLNQNLNYTVDISAYALREEWEKENRSLYRDFIPRLNPYSPLPYKLYNRIGNRLLRKKGYDNLAVFFARHRVCSEFKRHDLIVFVGADNFDYQTTEPNELNALITIASKISKAKKVLLDCSMQKENINSFFVRNLYEVDLVTVRDKLSYDSIKEYRSDVIFHADPAFLVEAEKPQNFWKQDVDYVGINVSPLVVEKNDMVIANMINVIDYIVKQTNYNILLIPHVMNKEDFSVLEQLKAYFAEVPRRVILLEDNKYSARELKYIISCCRFFIGARTHSVIAAYSSKVPTIAIGYSIKSTGIARDILGENNFCIQVSELQTEMQLKELFLKLVENENQYKRKLTERLPDYIASIKNLEEQI